MSIEVVEEQRMQGFPGIVFRDGFSGRRAALVGGPDIWEIASALRDLDLRRDLTAVMVAAEFTLSEESVRVALAYYAAFADEIDAEVADNDRAADEALAEWMLRQ